jgi:phosphosulfolactate phosphohydrolase-like enzyme
MLSRRPDPLHLAAVFGIRAGSAIRYTDAAHSPLEQDQNGHGRE